MPLSREILEQRAVKTGVKASKKRHHLDSYDSIDLVGGILKMIVEAVSNIDL